MSCCDDSLRLLYLLLDGELADERSGAVRAHLAGCPDCTDDAAVVEHVRAILRATCRAEPAPNALRTRVLSVLEQSVTVRGPGGQTTQTSVQIRYQQEG